jgi:hypothetical protein
MGVKKFAMKKVKAKRRVRTRRRFEAWSRRSLGRSCLEAGTPVTGVGVVGCLGRIRVSITPFFQ